MWTGTGLPSRSTLRKLLPCLLCASLLVALASCSKPSAEGELEFLPVLEEGVPEPLPAPPPEIEFDYSITEDCELVKLFEYASVEEYLAHNEDSVFMPYVDIVDTPYDGAVYVTHNGNFVTALYSTKAEPSLEVLNNALGILLTQDNINDIQARGKGVSYVESTSSAHVDYTETGWCVVRSLNNPDASWEGVS